MSDDMSVIFWLIISYVLIAVVAWIIGVKNEHMRSELKKNIVMIGLIFFIVAFFMIVMM
ncbi:hypothetical protein [Saccharibacillus sp. O23]|uniref:hypothetical protein n=1 Tax=Saccharibacillus sp. O23 TaxID=2009338 RepID=UPI0015C5FF40|nr:hypothetical protein [Saccharibacillus sp. O23]